MQIIVLGINSKWISTEDNFIADEISRLYPTRKNNDSPVVVDYNKYFLDNIVMNYENEYMAVYLTFFWEFFSLV